MNQQYCLQFIKFVDDAGDSQFFGVDDQHIRVRCRRGEVKDGAAGERWQQTNGLLWIYDLQKCYVETDPDKSRLQIVNKDHVGESYYTNAFETIKVPTNVLLENQIERIVKQIEDDYDSKKE